jgi:predicted AAA+ superfamily ATPase
MENPEIIDELVADFGTRPLPPITPRLLGLPGLPGKVDVVVGMRRSGKTWYLFQRIQELEAAGVGRDRILYLNLEDDRLAPLKAEDLHRIPEALYRRHPGSREQPCHFFLDEIQNVPGWERFVRRLVDSERVSLVLTGSSAKLLSREIATSLRGRSVASELLPFSFAEALRHAGLAVPERWPPPAAERSLLENRFERYLETGGFPEVQTLDVDLRLRVLQDYVDVVLFRDVAERHGVENLTALRYLERTLLAHPSQRFSVSRFYNDLKSQGIRVGKDTLHEYLGYLEDAFLLFTMTVASPSIRVRQVNPRKCYLVDPALASVASFKASQDQGHLLETPSTWSSAAAAFRSPTSRRPRATRSTSWPRRPAAIGSWCRSRPT